MGRGGSEEREIGTQNRVQTRVKDGNVSEGV